MDCSIIPKVRDKNNKIKDSRLFIDLLSLYNNDRESAKNMYLKTKNDFFIKTFDNVLTKDPYGEYTVESLLKKTDLEEVIGSKQIINNLEKKLKSIDKKNQEVWKEETRDSYKKTIDTIINFNNRDNLSSQYVALLGRNVDPKTGQQLIRPIIKVRDRINTREAEQIERNRDLNKRLESILKQNGVSVGVLDDLQSRLGINGVTDFSKATETAEGLIELINIADGQKGERVLPEEFAHFAIEALGSHPLVDRLISSLVNNNQIESILKDDYSVYYKAYNGDQTKLAKEAIGKLVAEHLLNNQPIEEKPYTNLLSRVISNIKDFFKKFSKREIRNAIIDTDNQISALTKELLKAGEEGNLNIRNISTSDKYYNLEASVERDKNILTKIIENEIKRHKIYSDTRGLNPEQAKKERERLHKEGKVPFSDKQEVFISDLEDSLKDNLELEGIYYFMEKALKVLNQLSKRLDSLADNTLPMNEKASILRDVRNYIYSYKEVSRDIREAILDDRKSEDNRYSEKAKANLDTLSSLIDDLLIQYDREAMPMFVAFLKPYIGDSIEVPFGKHKGKVMKVEKLAEMAEEDISFFDRWLDSMAESKDLVLKVFDQYNKDAKEKARVRTIDRVKLFMAEHMKAEKAGIKNFDWMFEKTKDGNRTSNYIRELNWGQFEQNKKEFFQEMREKYGKKPIGEMEVAYKKEVADWFKDNTISEFNEETGQTVSRPNDKYINPDFYNLTPAQKEYYNAVMDFKSEMDNYLPENYTNLFNTVKIRKDIIQRLRDANGLKEGWEQIKENIKDQFIRRSDDTDIGERAVIEDFEGRRVQSLPVYYTSIKKGESENDITTDVTSSLIAYASMAIEFDEMNKVIDKMELARDMVKARRVEVKEGDNTLVAKYKSLNRTVSAKLSKKGYDSNIAERLDKFFDMQVYNRYMKDEGTFGSTNVDRAKTAGMINYMTAMGGLALNALAGTANIILGRNMMRVEAMGGEFFKYRNVLKADSIYGQSLPEFLGEIGDRVRTSKLALWMEKFNVMQEYEGDIKNTNFDRKTWFSRMFNQSTLFFINNCGEHWMQGRTSLAVADTIKLVDANNNEISLWDAMEVKYIDENNKELGATLEVKEGIRKKDGSSVTSQDLMNFTNKVKAINQRMHGIYNKTDKSAIQNYALGRMAMLFRRWMRPGWNRRFQSVNYNMDLQEWTEGYYNTTGKFLWSLITDMKDLRLGVATRYNALSKQELANIHRAMTEVGMLMTYILAGMFLFKPSDPDEERSWLSRMTEYQVRRAVTEIGVFVPGPHMTNEGLKLVQTPAAGVTTISDLLNLVKLINPSNYEHFVGEDAVMQSGRFKGKSRAQKYLLQSPLLPMYNTVTKAMHPEDLIPFYKQ